MSKHFIYISLLIILLLKASFAQVTIRSYPMDTVISPKDTIKLNKSKLILTASMLPFTIAGVSIYLNKVWWSGQKVSFHFSDSLDWKYALKLDKAGHFWSCMFISDLFGKSLIEAGVPKNKAIWYGVGSTILLSTIVEIKDAYSPFWGFSMSDLGANILGSFYPLIQERYPVMQNFQIKWSYDFLKTSYYSTTQYHNSPCFLDDYERHNYWLIVDICNLFFKNQIKFDFFNIGVGLSAEWLDGHGHGEYELFFAFDLNIKKLIISKNKYITKIAHYINYYHLPSPALKVKPYTSFYGLTF